MQDKTVDAFAHDYGLAIQHYDAFEDSKFSEEGLMSMRRIKSCYDRVGGEEEFGKRFPQSAATLQEILVQLEEKGIDKRLIFRDK